MLTVSLTYLHAGQRRCVPMAYRLLCGLEAEDLLSIIKAVLRELDVDRQRIFCLAADGAAVNGVRRHQTNLAGKSVAAGLRQFLGHRMLSVHCACHRLQLAAQDAFAGRCV